MTKMGPFVDSEPPARSTGFHVWTAPGAPYEVRLHLAVVDRLHAEIRSAAAGASGAQPVCGLLLGRTLPHGRTIIIEDNLPLPSGGAPVPSSHLLEEGRAALRERMAKWSAGEDRRLWAIGYYQHRADGRLAVEESDVVLFQREFPGPASVMLVSGLDAGKPVGGFFFRSGDGMQKETMLAFPLSRMQLRESAGSVGKEANVAPPEADRSERRFTGHDAIRWSSLAAAVLALAAIGIAVYPAMKGVARSAGKAAAEQAASQLDFTADGTPEKVVLKWNRNAAAIRQAAAGELSITEGGSTQILMLNRTDLATGSVLYFPRSTSVGFQLEITMANGKKLSERVRLVAAREK